jgi:hypothetical protein
MSKEYEYIIVESFHPLDTSGRHGPIHVRPIPGQGEFKTDMYVRCSKSLSTDYPVGTKFRIKAKITNREGGAPFVHSPYSWTYEVLSS